MPKLLCRDFYDFVAKIEFFCATNFAMQLRLKWSKKRGGFIFLMGRCNLCPFTTYKMEGGYGSMSILIQSS